jgi:hypothetical protein
VVSRFDVVGGITGLIQGVLVTNVFVTTQGAGLEPDEKEEALPVEGPLTCCFDGGGGRI